MPPGQHELHPVLVLGQGYEPCQVVAWRRAIKLLYLGKAELLDSYTDRVLRSGHSSMAAPAVVRVLNGKAYHYRTQSVQLRRDLLYARDEHRCQYCGEIFPTHLLTYDHVNPKSRGGPKTWENLVAACKCCNQRKDHHTPGEAAMPLRKRPKRPRWLPPLLLQSWGGKLPEVWQPYIKWVLNAAGASTGA